MLVLGEWHLRKVLAAYTRHYNGHRPHQTLRQRPPLRKPGHVIVMTSRVERRQVVGSLISEYRTVA
jgi:putative transposase